MLKCSRYAFDKSWIQKSCKKLHGHNTTFISSGGRVLKNIFNLYCVHEQNKSAAKNEQYHQINHTFVQLCDLLGKNLHEHAKLKEFSVIKFCNLFFRGYLTFKQK